MLSGMSSSTEDLLFIPVKKRLVFLLATNNNRANILLYHLIHTKYQKKI